MTEPSGFVLGFDPGGKGRFGWSVCSTSGGTLLPTPKTGLADDALDALDAVRNALRHRDSDGQRSVLAAGIDAPLFWSTRGNRVVDDVLRRLLKTNGYPPRKLGGTVQQVNSLRGACLVQGVLLCSSLREKWDIPLSEAHPKALRYLLLKSGESSQADMVQGLTAGLDDHELDATLSAVAAWAMIHRPQGWRDLYCQEPSPVHPLDTSVGYWMPNP